jgi:hypothetical protein
MTFVQSKVDTVTFDNALILLLSLYILTLSPSYFIIFVVKEKEEKRGLFQKLSTFNCTNKITHKQSQ